MSVRTLLAILGLSAAFIVSHSAWSAGGVVVKSFPAIHTGDGPVSYIIEHAGMKVVFSGDTAPNEWFIKYANDADLVIHEAFMVPGDFVEWYNQPPQLAWRACCAFHTSGQAFGKIMSTIKPKQAVAYHFLNEEAWSVPGPQPAGAAAKRSSPGIQQAHQLRLLAAGLRSPGRGDGRAHEKVSAGGRGLASAMQDMIREAQK